MQYNRLVHFQKNPGNLSRYRLALGILYQLGVDNLLLDLARSLEVPIDHPDIMTVNALQNQRVLGFQQCIETLFSLDQFDIPVQEKVSPDYGATDRMVAEGLISKEDADKLTNEGEI